MATLNGAGRRLAGAVPKLVGRVWNDVASDLLVYLSKLLHAQEGIPGGYSADDPTTIKAGVAAAPGAETDGWSASQHVHPTLTATPSNATGAVANEGSGAPLMRADATIKQGIVTTKGDLLGFSASPDRVPVGTNTLVLVADSAQALGVKWALVGSVIIWDTDQNVLANQILGF